MLDDFLSQNCISFTLPGRNNQMYVGKDVQGESQFKPKMYILWTFSELASVQMKRMKNCQTSNFQLYILSMGKRNLL